MNLVLLYTVLALSLGLILFVMVSNRSHALRLDRNLKKTGTSNAEKNVPDYTDLEN